MGSILGAELGDNAFHVRLHRSFGDVQDLGNLAVGIAVCDLSQHLNLAQR